MIDFVDRAPTMKATLIKPETRSIDAVDIKGRDDIVRLIGYDTLESDAVGDAGDRLFCFGEVRFLRGTTGRFRIDRLGPFSGVPRQRRCRSTTCARTSATCEEREQTMTDNWQNHVLAVLALLGAGLEGVGLELA